MGFFLAPLGLSAVLLQSAASATAPGSVALPAPRTDSDRSLESALAARRSVRRWSGEPLTLAELGQLLWAAQGVTHAEGGRTAPSAGALYPLEVLVLAGRVEGLAPGIHRYRPHGHRLDLVAAGDARQRLSGAVQDWSLDAPAIVVVAAVEARTAAKYGARAGRYVAIEAGCAGQDVLLQAVALGLASVPIGAFDDAAVRRAARLGPGEQAILLLPVGRPAREGAASSRR